MTSAGTTAAYTVPADKTCVLFLAMGKTTAITGTSTIDASLAIGGNATSYNDFCTGSFATPTTTSDVISLSPNSNASIKSYAANKVIVVKVGPTISLATTETITLDLFGYLY